MLYLCKVVDLLSTMTTGLPWCKTKKMAVAKDQWSYESALASTLEELDLGFHGKLSKKKGKLCISENAIFVVLWTLL